MSNAFNKKLYLNIFYEVIKNPKLDKFDQKNLIKNSCKIFLNQPKEYMKIYFDDEQKA